MKEFKILEHIKDTPATRTKVNILKQYDSPVLRNIILYALSPFLTFRVNQVDFPDKFNTLAPDISEELFQLLDLLASHTVGTKEAKAMIKRLMAKTTEEDASWICKILRKDLKIGASDKLVNKAFPELIPTFSPMLCAPMIEPKTGDSHWEVVNYPAIAEIKVDGMRVIAVCDGVTVQFFSRDGLEILTLNHLIPQILSLKPGSKFVLDGESVGVVYNPNCKVAKKHFEAGKNWQFAQGLSMTKSKPGTYSEKEMNECLGYAIWDIIPYEYFTAEGKSGICKPLKLRKTELAGLFERFEKPPRSLKLNENVMVNNKEEAIQFFKDAVANGEEGAVLKDPNSLYEFKRSYAWLKVKEFFTADLKVLDCIEGTKGSSKEGSLGTMLVSDGTVTGKVMGGWSEDEGLQMWLEYKKGGVVGEIVEVIYKEITSDNNMRHCVFVRRRPDKSTCSLA